MAARTVRVEGMAEIIAAGGNVHVRMEITPEGPTVGLTIIT
jgi:hypothetical protein